MYAPETDRGVTVELHVRNELPPPAEAQAAQVYEGLAVLTGKGAVDDLQRSTWPPRTPIENPDCGLRDTYLAFREWADNHGTSLAPFFQIRECFTPDCGGWTDWLVTPAICLAVSEDGMLSAVYPHTDGSETYTVQDGLEALERALLDRSDRSPVSAD